MHGTSCFNCSDGRTHSRRLTAVRPLTQCREEYYDCHDVQGPPAPGIAQLKLQRVMQTLPDAARRCLTLPDAACWTCGWSHALTWPFRL
jgi:hypothetical protein